MSYTVGTNPKNAENLEKEVHSIPCKLLYTGPAQVQSNFIREKNEDETFERGLFRGRGIEGEKWKAPEGFEIHVLKERNGPKGVMLDIEGKKDEIMIWEWDKTCGEHAKRTAIGRAASYLKIAKALADD